MRICLIIAVVFSGFACGSESAPQIPAPDVVGADVAVEPPTEEGLTYYQDIKPVLDTMCVRCHKPGAIKQDVPLTTYEEVATWAAPIRAQVESGKMPPWPAQAGCHDYLYDESLTADERTNVLKWIDDGAIAGSPEVVPKPMREVEFAKLTRTDVEIEMPIEYTATVTPDEYRCFLLPWPGDKTQFITGFGAKPGNMRVVHHVIAYLIEPQAVEQFKAWDDADETPGYPCYGGPSGPGGGIGLGSGVRFLGGWAPGGVGADFAEGSGMRVEPGSMVALQIHYNMVFQDPEPDRTSVVFKVDDEVEHEALVQPWTNYQWLISDSMKIPAGEADVMHRHSADPFNLPIKIWGDHNAARIYSSSLHMHIRGVSGTVFVERPDGSIECLLNIPNYDFNWQRMFRTKEPLVIRPGDKLGIECHWDNSLANQPLVDGKPIEPVDITWGEGTLDEMCIAFFYVVPFTE